MENNLYGCSMLKGWKLLIVWLAGVHTGPPAQNVEVWVWRESRQLLRRPQQHSLGAVELRQEAGTAVVVQRRYGTFRADPEMGGHCGVQRLTWQTCSRQGLIRVAERYSHACPKPTTPAGSCPLRS